MTEPALVTRLARLTRELALDHDALAAPAAHAGDLHELRKFRHFFRNAYVLAPDPARVRDQAERLARVHPDVYASLAAVRAHVAALLAAAAR